MFCSTPTMVDGWVIECKIMRKQQLVCREFNLLPPPRCEVLRSTGTTTSIITNSYEDISSSSLYPQHYHCVVFPLFDMEHNPQALRWNQLKNERLGIQGFCRLLLSGGINFAWISVILASGTFAHGSLFPGSCVTA